MEIQLIFTQNNKLKIQIINNQYVHGDFKICFSLVYSIQDISGATISKKLGRYYEIHSQEDEIFLTLQEPRIGSYNLSCGPEGLFVLDKNDNNIECKIIPLKFEHPIEPIVYKDEKDKIFDPVIPLPNLLKLDKKIIPIKDLTFKIPTDEENFFDNLKNIFYASNIKFNTSSGCSIVFKRQDLKSEEYKINIKKEFISIEYSDYGGKLYSIITLIQLINFYKTYLPICSIEDKPSLN